MAMVPHERSLVKKFEGKPFALLGVNADAENPNLREAVSRAQITWRSWADPSNAILGRWQVNALPTLVLIDATGVIRLRQVGGGTSFEPILEKLVKEAEAAGPRQN
jgi:hypothetical protein